MIVDNLDFIRVIVLPRETGPNLVTDPDAMLAFSVYSLLRSRETRQEVVLHLLESRKASGHRELTSE